MEFPVTMWGSLDFRELSPCGDWPNPAFRTNGKLAAEAIIMTNTTQMN
jgi:hypothetical protein